MLRQVPIRLSSVIIMLSAGCTAVTPPARPVDTTSQSQSTGTVQASFYGAGDGLAGQRTANGEKLDPEQLTAAHKTYPFGTRLQVTSKETGKSVNVRVNDRGPYVKGRSLDLSPKAAQELGIVTKGVDTVTVKVLPTPGPKAEANR